IYTEYRCIYHFYGFRSSDIQLQKRFSKFVRKKNVMEEVRRIDTVKQYNDEMGVETEHPLVSIVNFDEIPTYIQFRRYMGLYCIFLKNIKCGDMRYGCQPYDYDEGTLVFIAPGQVYGIDSSGQVIKPSGRALVFHPDMIAGTQLGKSIKDYTFFSYA